MVVMNQDPEKGRRRRRVITPTVCEGGETYPGVETSHSPRERHRRQSPVTNEVVHTGKSSVKVSGHVFTL